MNRFWPADVVSAPAEDRPPVSSLGAGSAEPQAEPQAEPSAPPAASPYEGYTLLADPQVVEALVLTVDDHVITVNDVLGPLRYQLQAVAKRGDDQTFRAETSRLITEELRRQIGQMLVLTEAERTMGDQEKDYVSQQTEAYLRDMIAEAGGSRSKLDELLRQEGGSLEETTNAIHRQSMTRFYLQRKFSPQLGATRKELRQYYKAHVEEFSEPTKVKMQILALEYAHSTDGGHPTPQQRQSAKTEALDKAAEALRRIENGEDFGKVVRETSDSKVYRAAKGGVWDYVSAGSLRESQVEAAAFRLAPRQVSGIIEGKTGAFIVKTLDIRPGKVTPFEQAQEKIKHELWRAGYERLTTDYFRQLREKATITKADAFEELILARVMAIHRQR